MPTVVTMMRISSRTLGLALAVSALAMVGNRGAHAQSSLYNSSPYHSSPYRTSPYRPDYSPSSNLYGPRNYSGLMSNYDYRRLSPSAYVNALYSTPALYGGWNFRWPWGAGLPYSLRYGLGFRGPYYPNYYYGYSNYFRPWYRSYRPFGVGVSGWPFGGGWGLGGIFGPGFPDGLPLGAPWQPGVPMLEGIPQDCPTPLENAPVEEVVSPVPKRIYSGLYYW